MSGQRNNVRIIGREPFGGVTAKGDHQYPTERHNSTPAA